MLLSDAKCKAAKPKTKPYKLADSGGLYLEIKPNGSKHWRLKYRFLGKEKKLTFGAYPTIGLSAARGQKDTAKNLLANLIDPSQEKLIKKLELVKSVDDTFKAIALEWYEINKYQWSEIHAKKIMQRLEKNLFPDLASVPIAKINTPMLLTVLRKIEKRDALDIIGRCRQALGAIFRYAIQIGIIEYNPVPNLLGALKTRKVTHFPSIETNEIPALIKAIENPLEPLETQIRLALKLSMLTFVRPNELRHMEETEIDFEKMEWRIPGHKMKMGLMHIVPLSTQAVAIIRAQLKNIEGKKTKYVFPSFIDLNKPMSDNTLRMALHRLGYKDRMTPHGFRALARTTIREELDYEADIIEAQLAHKPMGSLGAAYDRAKFLKQRRPMMQDWADYLDRL